MNAHLKMNQKKLKFLLLFSIFSMTVYSVYIYSSYQYTYNHLFLKLPVLVEYTNNESVCILQEKNSTSVVEIVFWISPTNPPSSGRQRVMKEMVDKMNLGFENVCTDEIDNTEVNYNCRFDMKSGNISDVDAVVFFMFLDGYNLPELPSLSERRQDQFWVMFALEPPAMSKWKDPLRNIVNLTVTNRMDSDVWAPYGVARPKSSSNRTSIKIGNYSLEEWISGKSNFVVGVISNCHSKSRRENLISKMNETGIGQVDIFGNCGKPPPCGRMEDDCSEFWDKIGEEYKFFLAFENSLCKDYITEKFWRALTVGMVPVVYGAGEYKIEAPPESYIDVKDFKTVEELMTYLTVLDKDDKLYSKYFQWRASYKIDMEKRGWSTRGWCSLCKVVSDHKRKTGNLEWKVYEDLEWWYKHQPNSNESACADPPSFV